MNLQMDWFPIHSSLCLGSSDTLLPGPRGLLASQSLQRVLGCLMGSQPDGLAALALGMGPWV